MIRTDPFETMKSWALELPDQIRGATARFLSETGPVVARSSRSIFLGGMGGSAAACRLAQSFVADRLDVPCLVQTDPGLPRWVGSETAVGIVSYSGNTWESLAIYHEAKGRGCPLFVVASGGELARLCQERPDPDPLFLVPQGYEPRAALGWMLAPVALALGGLAHGPEIRDRLEQAAASVSEEVDLWREGRSREGRDPLGLASSIAGRTAYVYSASATGFPVAARWKTQILENTEQMAHAGSFPELAHNEIMGWSFSASTDRPVFLLLEDRSLEDPMRRRSIEASLAELSSLGAEVARVAPGDGAAGAQMLAHVALGDLVSVEAARIRGVNPVEVRAIRRLKKTIAPDGTVPGDPA